MDKRQVKKSEIFKNRMQNNANMELYVVVGKIQYKGKSILHAKKFVSYPKKGKKALNNFNFLEIDSKNLF